ncbi:YheC/D like ATP-grasp [Pelagirhabdus alkalitolerans]|uniref:YheC/D like ATP-grasp n=1 Tax=Pelagirhabdus alkalitolerans TaxID=1612202 RepID=A0A1G6L5C9_9BACI|nr:YheC/YheD family protein [Pelagirhabdus alkalitolerans]SDC38424.1 YheC/D like ATP-grasp [Pelagirhabdus alkalitolerans]
MQKNELLQVSNILNTIIDATKQFQEHIRENDFDKSIFVFTSMVEGLSSIDQLVKSHSIKSEKLKKQIDTVSEQIVKELELKNYAPLFELTQFNLLPLLGELDKNLLDTIDYKKQTITIGIFDEDENPVALYPEKRIDALINEAEKQNVDLCFFTSKDVELDKGIVNGTERNNGEFIIKKRTIPDVVHNLRAIHKNRQSNTERKLRRKTLFTSFHVIDKLYLPKQMAKHRDYANLLIPFEVVKDEDSIIEFLNQKKKAVVKPIKGVRGLKIFYIEMKNNQYKVLDHDQTKLLNKPDFIAWLKNEGILKGKQFLIQNYVKALTKNNEPYDFRAHMQKDRDGQWVITKIYPRIGSKHSILSNISRGGRSEDIKEFFDNQFGKVGCKYYENLKDIAKGITNHLDKLYNYSLDELGLDLTLDDQHCIWLHEVNNGPQSTYHEEERAVNTIGYAKYIAENGILKTNQRQKIQFSEKQFDVQKSPSLKWHMTEQISVGMLITPNEFNELAVACAYAAKYEEVNFFCFSPIDIDFEKMLIRGYFYENKEWVAKIVEYPEVIYDRLRLKNHSMFNIVYDELEGIPITNQFKGGSLSKLEVYNKLSQDEDVSHYVIPFKRVERVKDIENFIDKFNEIIIKPEVGSFAMGVHYVYKKSIDEYVIIEKDKKRTVNYITFTNYFRKSLKKDTFIVQQYISTRTVDDRPFDLRVHMLKNGHNKWECAIKYVRIGFNYATISAANRGGQISTLEGFAFRNISNMTLKELDEKIEFMTQAIALSFEESREHAINEIAFDIAIDENLKLHLIEINVNKPGIVFQHFQVAKLTIDYCKFLAQIDK